MRRGRYLAVRGCHGDTIPAQGVVIAANHVAASLTFSRA
jgi:hypothetical protein